jgi:hypothetical protein
MATRTHEKAVKIDEPTSSFVSEATDRTERWRLA